VAASRPSGGTLGGALSGSAVLAGGAVGLLLWSRRRAASRGGNRSGLL
jgi:chitin-binding protein